MEILIRVSVVVLIYMVCYYVYKLVKGLDK